MEEIEERLSHHDPQCRADQQSSQQRESSFHIPVLHPGCVAVLGGAPDQDNNQKSKEDCSVKMELIKLEKEPLTPEYQQVAELELRETPEIVQESVEKLRELLHNDKTLKMRDDDEFLIRFLRPHKYYPESALEAMRRAMKFKKEHDSILKDLMPEDEEEVFHNHDVLNVLANRDQHGRRILIMHMGAKWNPSQVTSEQMFRLLYVIHIGAMQEPQTQVCGIDVIMDFKGLSMKQIKALGPKQAFRIISFVQDAMPIRLKEVHIVNQPYIFNILWAVIKPILKDKLKKRIYFHGSNMTSLHKHLNPTHLPADYSGVLPEINYSGVHWYPVLRDVDDKIREWNECCLVPEEKK